MNLFAPAGLAALLLLPPVVLIHLWRIRYRRRTLPSTLLWSRVLHETPLRRPRRLPTRWLLLLLELAVLVCGALALARPAFVAAGTGRRLLVAVDSSLLMGAADVRPSRLDRARGLAARLVDGLGARDSMTLVDAGATPRVLLTSSDHLALRRALDRLTPGDGPSSLAEDGALLAGLAASGGTRATPYLFTPLGTDATVLDALRAAVPGLKIQTVGTTSDDRAVSGLSVSCLSGRAGGTRGACEAYARLVNTGTRAITTRVTAAVDGQSASEPLTLPANASQQIHLPLPAGARAVELHIDGHDALAADDTAWAIVPRPIHRNVLLVTGDPASPLAQGLRAMGSSVTLGIITPDDSALDAVARRADLTVLDETNPQDLPPGNLLFINPTAGTYLFNTAGSGETVAPGVTGLDRASLLLRNVDLGSLVVSAATRLTLPAWAHADIAGDGGPLLFSGVTGGRRVAVLTFDPRPGAGANSSNLDTLLAFPALLQNLVQALAPAPPMDATAGQAGAAPLARQDTATLAPDGGAATMLPSSGDLAALPALHPGLYTLTGAAGGGKSPIAVNVTIPSADAAGDTALLAAAAVAPAAPAAFPTVPSPPTPWEGWVIGAVLALLLLGGEWWYYVRHT